MSLQAAIQRRDLPTFINLVNSGTDLTQTYGGNPPLGWAVYAGIDYVRPLVERGADVNIRTSAGGALGQAADRGNIEIVRLLISHGADVNFVGHLGSPLYRAMSSDSNVEIARVLLENGADVNGRGDRGSYTPLQKAASLNSLEKVRLLINHGADPNIPDFQGNTPLHHAIRYGANLEIVKYLIEHGARIDIPNEDGETAENLAERVNPRLFEKIKEARRAKFYVDRYVIGRPSEPVPDDAPPNDPRRQQLPDDILRIISGMAGNISFGKKLDSDIRYLRKLI